MKFDSFNDKKTQARKKSVCSTSGRVKNFIIKSQPCDIKIKNGFRPCYESCIYRLCSGKPYHMCTRTFNLHIKHNRFASYCLVCIEEK